MPLSSSSTLVQVQAEYDDTAGYFADGSVALAKRFIVAVQILLRRLPAESGTRDAHVQYDLPTLRAELTEAREFIKAHDAGATSSNPSVTRIDFTNFR
jgi:hypothetical protein